MGDQGKCSACGGAREEHGPGLTQHVFTLRDGELKSHDQVERESRQSSQGPVAIRLPGAQTNEAGAIGRLVEVLRDKGLLSDAEALYVAGMGSKPEKKPQFRDPALFDVPDPRQRFYVDSPGAGY